MLGFIITILLLQSTITFFPFFILFKISETLNIAVIPKDFASIEACEVKPPLSTIKPLTPIALNFKTSLGVRVFAITMQSSGI